MSAWPDDFVKNVLNDVNGKRTVKKAGIIERLIVTSASPAILHPNPMDEFSKDSVGPNFEIVNKYANEIISWLAPLHLQIFKEPLIVEKIEEGGYMLINGHHRWFAALRCGVKKIHIHIVNLVHEADMDRMMKKNSNVKRVSFDLDEVLLEPAEERQEKITSPLFSKRIKERLKKGVPNVIKAFQNDGYDVWVYTAGYNSEEYINDLFSMYGITVDGILNGFNEKRMADNETAKRIRDKMSQKYTCAIHVDTESVLLVDTNDHSYEQYDIADKGEWAKGVLDIVRDRIAAM